MQIVRLPTAVATIATSSCQRERERQSQYPFSIRAANFLIRYYRDTDLRAMSYEGIEITVKTILDDDRDHVAYVNSPMADGVDLTNVMAIQLMPRGFLRNTDRYEKHIVKAIDAVLVHLQVRDRITDQDIQDLVFNWEYARVVVKLLGVDS